MVILLLFGIESRVKEVAIEKTYSRKDAKDAREKIFKKQNILRMHERQEERG
jgi:hypothetical protein